MKKNMKRIGSMLSGSALMLSGAQAVAQEMPVAIQEAQQAPVAYDKVSHVQGVFSYNQNVLSPADNVFSMFGTAVTAMCAKPAFAFDEMDRETYYLNVKGDIRESYSLSLAEIQERQSSTKIMACSCSTGPAVTNARVTGVAIGDLLPLSQMQAGVNTIALRDKDGYGLEMPLSYVLEKEGMLVWAVNDVELTDKTGGPVQVWMPDTVARYFTRQVCEIELLSRETLPTLETPEDAQRAKVAIVNRASGEAFKTGSVIGFEGYADDCGKVISAVEFSLDGGETWTSCATEGVSSERWVYWNFGYLADQAGTFNMQVRARCEDGTVSPLAANVVFTVEDEAPVGIKA